MNKKNFKKRKIAKIEKKLAKLYKLEKKFYLNKS